MVELSVGHVISIAGGLFTLIAGLVIFSAKRVESGIYSKITSCHDGIKIELSNIKDNNKETRDIAVKSLENLSEHVEKFHTGD